MKIYFSLLLFILFSNISNVAFAVRVSSNVKGSFSGTIKNASGVAIEGASVYIADTKAGSSTNSKGEFLISNVSEGVHLVEISHIGFTTIAENINITGDVHKDYVLVEAIVENNAVIVTGVTKATQLKKVPFQVSVLRKEELQQSASANIIESITRKAGVSSISTGPSISKPLIRGLGYNRVLTINDGVRQEGQQWGDEHGIEIDEASVNKIEVLKGPASLVYGSDAMAGVINIITNVPVEANTLQLNAGSNYQSNNNLRSFFGNFAGNVSQISWNAYGTIKAASDYQNKFDGYVLNSKFNERNFGGYVGVNGGWGFSHLVASNFNLKAGLVEGDRDDEGFFVKSIAGGSQIRATHDDFNGTKPGIPYQHIRHFKIATDNSFKIGDNRLSANIGWQQNKRQEFGNPDDLNESELFFDLKTVTYTTQFHFKEKKNLKTSIGINGMGQGNINRGEEQLIPDYSLNDLGGYGFFQKENKNLTVSGGARFDSRHIRIQDLLEGGIVKGEGFSKAFSNFSGSIGAAYELTKTVNLKLNFARAFRAPSIPELASNGSHEGTTRFEYGHKDLQSEISTQADIGFDYNNQHFSINLAGYYNNFKNFIFYRKLVSINGGDSIINAGGEDLTAFKFDQRKARLTGLETTLDIHPHPLDWLHLQNTFSFVSGRLRESIEGTNNLPFIPAPKLLTELRVDFKTMGKGFLNSYVKIEIENNFKQARAFTAFNTETQTPAYTLLHAGVGTDVKNKNDKTIFTVNFNVNNITDEAYQNHLSRLKYAALNRVTGRAGVYNMGRNFSLKLNVPFRILINKK